MLFMANAKGRNFSRVSGRLGHTKIQQSIKDADLAAKNCRLGRRVSGPQISISQFCEALSRRPVESGRDRFDIDVSRFDPYQPRQRVMSNCDFKILSDWFAPTNDRF
jgi:hypothetical protein